MSTDEVPTPTKSQRTRAAILAAARDHFGRFGYDRTSIRAIAAEASIDPSMVIRYFTSKQALFAAAVDVDLMMPDLTTASASRRGRLLVEHFLSRWEGELSDDVLVILLRTAVTDELVAERLRTVFVGQVAEALRPLVDDDLRRRAGLIASQLMGIAMARYLLRLPGMVDRDVAGLVADVAPTIQRYLAGKLPAV